jgi:signal transduction histidine kinase
MTDLAELLNAKRSEVMDRWLRRIKREHGSDDLSTAELRDHLPIFFSELLDTLTHRKEPTEAESTATAAKHGEQRLRHGFDVDAVVREYDLLGDTILEAAASEGITFSIAEARVLLQLLYAGTAEAVAAYVQRRNEEAQRQAGEHLAFIAHELRNPLGSARTALAALRRTALASGGKLVELLDRNLARLRELVDQVLTAQQASRIEVRWERLVLQDVLAKAAEELEPEAENKGVRLALDVEDGLVIEGDRRLLHSVATNLVSNAVKFSRPGGTIMIRGRRQEDRAIVEVEDACGGLPDGSPADLFKPYVQRGEDRSGLGLGLAIVKQAIEAHGGAIDVRNQPGAGCVFIVAVPCVAR